MTKDRARKQAARKRAALTGESYVVAQRAIAEQRPHDLGRMHDLVHKVPGVPTHVDGGLQGATSPRRRNSNPGLQSRNHLRHNEPRVLVAWQNWIARRLRVESH
jgi:hypothetical protein